VAFFDLTTIVVGCISIVFFLVVVAISYCSSPARESESLNTKLKSSNINRNSSHLTNSSSSSVVLGTVVASSIVIDHNSHIGGSECSCDCNSGVGCAGA